MIREAKPGDEYAIIDLIKELAVYEKEPLSSVKNTPAQLAKDLFNDRICSAYVCLLYTSPSPRDQRGSRMPSSA